MSPIKYIHVINLYQQSIYFNLKIFLKFHPSFDPREERAALLRLNGLDDSNKSYSHSYLISVGKEGARSDKGVNMFIEILHSYENPIFRRYFKTKMKLSEMLTA